MELTCVSWYSLPLGKKKIWERLGELVNSFKDPWLLIGHLNEVVDFSKKMGGGLT